MNKLPPTHPDYKPAKEEQELRKEYETRTPFRHRRVLSELEYEYLERRAREALDSGVYL